MSASAVRKPAAAAHPEVADLKTTSVRAGQWSDEAGPSPRAVTVPESRGSIPSIALMVVVFPALMSAPVAGPGPAPTAVPVSMRQSPFPGAHCGRSRPGAPWR